MLKAIIEFSLRNKALVLVATAGIFGVPFVTGFHGLLVILALATLLNLGVSAATLILALKVLTLESYISVMCCLALPLIFASTIMFPTAFMPEWLAKASGWNPLSYAAAPIRRLINVGWIWHELYSGLSVMAGLAVSLSAAMVLVYRKPRYSKKAALADGLLDSREGR